MWDGGYGREGDGGVDGKEMRGVDRGGDEEEN